MIKLAEFSDCRKYRYSLSRVWDTKLPGVLFIGLNPSTADETTDDPTIRRCINYAKDWGFGGLVMANIFAFRASKPKDMKSATDPIGSDNDIWLKNLSKTADLTIAAWGNDGAYLGRGKQVLRMISKMSCLKLTKSGHPGHPLYLKKDLKPIAFDDRAEIEPIILGNTTVFVGDCMESLKQIPDESVNCCVTSPPYWGLRDYGTAKWDGGDKDCDHIESEIRTGQGLEKWSKDLRGGGKKQGKINGIGYKSICQKCGALQIDQQIGLEKTPEEFVKKMVEIFREVRRVLRSDGVLWLNLGDSYISNPNPDKGDRKNMEGRKRFDRPNSKKLPGLKQKDLVGIPWRVALALQADGWYLRQDIIWHKPNPMPESCQDRCTKAHEYIFLLSKSAKYYYDHKAIKEPSMGYQHPSKLSFDRIVQEPARPGQKYSQHRLGRQAIPSGQDTGSGSHGNFHKEGRKNNNEYVGKHSEKESQASGRRVLKSMKNARDVSGSHDHPFGAYRNKRSVWTVATHAYKGAHFATFPTKLIEPCILAGCPKGGTVLDPFGGSGTTAFVSNGYGRKAILCELNPDNVPLIQERIMGFREEVEPEISEELGLFG